MYGEKDCATCYVYAAENRVGHNVFAGYRQCYSCAMDCPFTPEQCVEYAEKPGGQERLAEVLKSRCA